MTRKKIHTRKSKRQSGGLLQEKTILQNLQNNLESLFTKHKPVEIITIPLKSTFYLSIVIQYEIDVTSSIDKLRPPP